MMDFNELFLEGTTVPPGPGAVDLMQPQPTPGMNFASTMSGPMEFEAAHVPAKTPQEIEQRRSGWMKVWENFQTNPNLQRAMMLVGAQLAQPIQPGQTTSGAIAQSAVVGMNAYQLGQKEELAMAAGQRREQRDERRLGIEEGRLGLESRRVGEQEKTGAITREGAALDVDLKRQTLPELVQ